MRKDLTSSLEGQHHSKYGTFFQNSQSILDSMTPSDKSLSNVNGSSCKHSNSKFSYDNFTGFLIGYWYL